MRELPPLTDDRQTGKTTNLFELAIDLIADGNEVFITGAHTSWLRELELRFKEAGLEGAHFLTVDSIQRGALRGRVGRLLIDDAWDLPWRDREYLREEQRRMEVRGL